MSQLPLDLQFISTPGRDDFLVSDCNRLATSWIDRWPDWPGQYRVLNLVGPAASGKSHLAAIWSLQADAHAITELADGTAPANENLVLDNLDAGNAWNEEALFHLVNRTADGAASVLVTSEMPVAAMEWSLPDLSSRMRAVAVATLDAPDDALLRALLEAHTTAVFPAIPKSSIQSSSGSEPAVPGTVGSAGWRAWSPSANSVMISRARGSVRLRRSASERRSIAAAIVCTATKLRSIRDTM